MFRKNGARNYPDLLDKNRRKSVVSAIPRQRDREGTGRNRHRWYLKLSPPAGGRRTFKIVWIASCLALLSFAFFNSGYTDHEVIFVSGMIGLTFPAGVLVAAAFAFLIKATHSLTGMSFPSCFSFDLLMWPFFVAVGYCQWFVVPRRLSRAFRKNN